MNRNWVVTAFIAVAFPFLLCSCSGSSSRGSGAGSSTAPSPSNHVVQPGTPAAEIDPCSKFSAADAQAIMGVPMQLSPGHGAIVCTYQETSPKSGMDTARVSLTLNVRKSAAEEDRTWNNT